MLLLLAACSGSPEGAEPVSDATVLVELATVLSTDLYRGLHFAVGDDDLWAMANGETLGGTSTLPGDADPDEWDVDANGTAEWSVTHTVDADGEGIHRWDWSIALSLERLGLPSADVAVDGAWGVDFEVYDYQLALDTFEGTVAVEDGAPVAVRFDTVGTWDTLNAVEGTIDGAAVTWENEDPDVP